MADTAAHRSNRTGWLILGLALAVTLVVVLTLNSWADRHADDVNTDHLVEQLCEGTPDC
jgi:hypothetical protein